MPLGSKIYNLVAREPGCITMTSVCFRILEFNLKLEFKLHKRFQDLVQYIWKETLLDQTPVDTITAVFAIVKK